MKYAIVSGEVILRNIQRINTDPVVSSMESYTTGKTSGLKREPLKAD